jgi:hypothetical protein
MAKVLGNISVSKRGFLIPSEGLQIYHPSKMNINVRPHAP